MVSGQRPKSNQLIITPFENADLSQFRDSLDAAAKLCRLEPVFSNDLYFTYPLTEAESKRRQRDAVCLIRTVRESLEERNAGKVPVLIVTNQDLFAGRSVFVFGIANSTMRLAAMSTARLTRWFEGITPSIVQERILKEAAHEAGHLVALEHCTVEACPMAQSSKIEEIDTRLPVFCKACRIKITKLIFT